jgi:hypothetical protein
MTPATDPQPEVEQVDRDAACEISAARGADARTQAAYAHGYKDHMPLVQAFARHRAAAHEAGRVEGVREAAEVADEHACKTDTPDDFTLGYEASARSIAESIRALSKEPTK